MLKSYSTSILQNLSITITDSKIISIKQDNIEYGLQENPTPGLSSEGDCENGEGDGIRETLFAGIIGTTVLVIKLSHRGGALEVIVFRNLGLAVFCCGTCSVLAR